MTQKPQATARPYTLTFKRSGNAHPLTSEEAQRLIDLYWTDLDWTIDASPNRVAFLWRGGAVFHEIRPATLGGGPAFTVPEDGEVRTCRSCGFQFYLPLDGDPTRRCPECNVLVDAPPEYRNPNPQAFTEW